METEKDITNKESSITNNSNINQESAINNTTCVSQELKLVEKETTQSSNNDIDSANNKANNVIKEEEVNETLYVKNLNERIKESEMRKTLTNLFSKFGELLEIKIKNNYYSKGQAFIVFKNKDSSSKAKQMLNNTNLYNKKLIIQYSKSKSDAYLKYIKEYNEENYLKRKRENKEKHDKLYEDLKQKELSQKRNFNTRFMNNSNNVSNGLLPNMMSFNPAMLLPGNNPFLPKNNLNEDINSSSNVGVDSNLMKNASFKLYISGITKDTDESDLIPLFESIPGFKDLRLSASKGLCFVEYENEKQASQALLANNGVEVNGSYLNITFARVM